MTTGYTRDPGSDEEFQVRERRVSLDLLAVVLAIPSEIWTPAQVVRKPRQVSGGVRPDLAVHER